jgi:hypothetical protein
MAYWPGRAMTAESAVFVLETTKAQLEARYAKVGALLNRRYFTQ